MYQLPVKKNSTPWLIWQCECHASDNAKKLSLVRPSRAVQPMKKTTFPPREGRLLRVSPIPQEPTATQTIRQALVSRKMLQGSQKGGSPCSTK